ncbi:MAG TPA: hypothetical protein VL221_05280 [Bacteroidota bacterium]|nr:hypothetical protein [Bacteroidota bacterium]
MPVLNTAALAVLYIASTSLCPGYPSGPGSPADSSARPSAAPADTQVIPLPFEVLITAPRMSVPLRETAAPASVAWEWRLGGISGVLSVQGRNLADTKYVAFTEPDSGGNSYQPGAGREIMGGLRIHL